MAITLPFRIYLFRRHCRSLRTSSANTESSVLSIPLYEFYSDVAIWAVNTTIVLSYLGYKAVNFQIHLVDALKYGFAVFFGFMVTGLIVGMISFLEMEKELIELLVRQPMPIKKQPAQGSSMFKKFNLLLISIIVILSVVTAYVLFNNLVALTEKNRPFSLTDIYYLFSKMLAISIVLLGSGVSIVNRIARNTKLLFNLQLNVLKKVQHGDYASRIPIVSSDEFSVIAYQTNQMIEGLKEREFIRDTFGRYVTEEVRDLILSRKIPLNGEVRTVTILFSDIRNFSTYSESRHPREVIAKINAYFAEMTEVIHKNGGIVLEYLGDGIEAVFGAPSTVQNHSERAIQSALEMRIKLMSLNQYWEEKNDTPLKHGIGIHTGEVVAGIVGPPSRLSYKMIGDTVNLAARIQELTKTFDSDILISGNTYQSLNNQFNTRCFGTVTVRGKKIETDIYGVL
ncbi:adenylate/guanylate cyclase domain-containing protein [uncultured Desulfosarcina sp.]|uniref:adenylate/guanylate cyclase domain-containing protein n=1 Tax=uncultured Desulfosarcina sp. TaxID=218289 RepID=UPI0029C6D781|nr:adenylate/guanylate cyclase domain-containing protein [uncultured Desulfosarcina sp.]